MWHTSLKSNASSAQGGLDETNEIPFFLILSVFVKLPDHKSLPFFPKVKSKTKQTSGGDPITFCLCLHFLTGLMLSGIHI